MTNDVEIYVGTVGGIPMIQLTSAFSAPNGEIMANKIMSALSTEIPESVFNQEV